VRVRASFGAQIPAFAVSQAIQAIIPVTTLRSRSVRPSEAIIACAARLDSHIYRCESNRDPRHEQRHSHWNHVVLKPWVKMQGTYAVPSDYGKISSASWPRFNKSNWLQKSHDGVAAATARIPSKVSCRPKGRTPRSVSPLPTWAFRVHSRWTSPRVRRDRKHGWTLLWIGAILRRQIDSHNNEVIISGGDACPSTRTYSLPF
jgi:hypothetical protein